MPIRSFKDARAKLVFRGMNPRKGFPADLICPLLRKLELLHNAAVLDDLRQPPGNRLEALKGDLEGRWSIRINDQFRLVFSWSDSGADAVEMTDYH